MEPPPVVNEPDRVTPDRLNAAATDLLVAEYEFVSGLIPFYRRVEMTVLAGTGLALSGVVAALAALEAAQHPKPHAEAILLTVGAWAPTFLLLVENMALTRLQRASLFIAKDLYPLATRLTGRTDVLRWELAPGERLMESVRYSGPVKMFASSVPLLVTIAMTSLAFAVAGLLINATTLNLCLGVLASVISIGLAVYGIGFTWGQEQRKA